MANFWENMNETRNVSVTENGAIGYRTTGKALLDLNFSVASLRSAPIQEIQQKFWAAFTEGRMTAMKWLFFARDVRGGLGERRLFRVILQDLAEGYPDTYVAPVLKLIPEYGRWDDLWCLLKTPVRGEVLDMVQVQFASECIALHNGENISFLAKWLPSINASSANTRLVAKDICAALGLTERRYRKTLSAMRKKLDVVEKKMSNKEWSEIRYEGVPSKANLVYKDAFLRHDRERREQYLASLENGNTKINAGTLYPYEIVHKYLNDCETTAGRVQTEFSSVGWHWTSDWSHQYPAKEDDTLEQLWKALPDTVGGCDNTIVVMDGSGSMSIQVGKTKVTAQEVASSLAIYFAEKCSGQFKDRFITFSRTPQFVDMSRCCSLQEKLKTTAFYTEVADTNIEAVFDLILDTVIQHDMSQEEIPKNVLIISDMEFNCCALSNSGPVGADPKLFEVISKKYEDAGYNLPRLVFWNVNSRTNTIPVKENEMGVALVSGFSQNIARMVMSGKIDPYECLLETLDGDRYKPVAEAIQRTVRCRDRLNNKR